MPLRSFVLVFISFRRLSVKLRTSTPRRLVAPRGLLQVAGNNGLLLPCLQIHSSSCQTRGFRFRSKINRRWEVEWEISLSRVDLRNRHLLFRSDLRIDQSFKPRPAFPSPAKFSLSTALFAAGFSAPAISPFPPCLSFFLSIFNVPSYFYYELSV